VPRPDRELAAFTKVTLDASQKSTISLALDDKAFAYWDTGDHRWATDPGTYELLIGASSQDIRATVEVTLP
jgi:beta-glucosidase